MRLSIERDPLAATLANQRKTIPARSTIPILEMAQLTANNDGLIITTTDLVAQCRETLAATIEEAGDTCIDVKKFHALVSHLPKGEVVTLETQGPQLRMCCGRCTALFNTQDPADFPSFSFPETAERWIIPASELGRVIRATLLAAATVSETRSYLAGLHFSADGQTVWVAATDGHRLHVAKLDLPTTIPFPAITVPTRTSALLASLMRDNDADVIVEISQHLIRIGLGSVELTSKLIDGPFPDYQKVVAPRAQHPALFDAGAMVSVLKRAAAVIDADPGNLKPRGARLHLRPDQIEIVSGDPLRPEFYEQIDAVYRGPAIEIGLMTRYVEDAITALGDGELELHAVGTERPVRFCCKDNVDESVSVMTYRA